MHHNRRLTATIISQLPDCLRGSLYLVQLFACRYDSIDIRSQVLVGSNQSTTKFHNEALICCNAKKESSQTNDKRQRGQPRHPVYQGVGTFHLGAPSRPPIEAVGRWSATASFDGVTHRCAKIDREAVNKKLLAACEKRK